MSSVGLLFVGAVLFVDGLLFLGKVDPKAAASLNLFVGALQTAIPFWLLVHARTPDDVFGAAGLFLFGFTYLYVGINNLAGFSGAGLGWYAAWVAVLAALFGVTAIVRYDDLATGLLWLQWSVLWGLFFLVLALGVERLTAPAGWLTVIQSFTTCTIPGFLLLLGEWDRVPVWAIAASIAASVVAVVAIDVLGRTPARHAAVAPAAAPALV
jgi:hypothetical protein